MTMTPTSADQCVGCDENYNKRVRAGWAVNPKKRQDIFIITNGKVIDAKFSHFTLSGFRAYWTDGLMGSRVFRWRDSETTLHGSMEAALSQLQYNKALYLIKLQMQATKLKCEIETIGAQLQQLKGVK